MTIEQFFRSLPLADAIVVREREGASRILAGAGVIRGSGGERSEAPSSRKLLRGLVALRKDGKKR